MSVMDTLPASTASSASNSVITLVMEAMGTSSSACISYRMSPVSVHIKSALRHGSESVGACTLEASTLCASPSKAYGSAAGAPSAAGSAAPWAPGSAVPRAAGSAAPWAAGSAVPPAAGAGVGLAGRPSAHMAGQAAHSIRAARTHAAIFFFIISIPLSGFWPGAAPRILRPRCLRPRTAKARAAAAQKAPPAPCAGGNLPYPYESTLRFILLFV